MSGLWFVVCIPKRHAQQLSNTNKTQVRSPKISPSSSPSQSRPASLQSSEVYQRGRLQHEPAAVNEIHPDVVLPDPEPVHQNHHQRRSSISSIKVADSYLEDILEDTLRDLKIHDAVWTSDKSDKCYQVYFPCEYGVKSDEALALLTAKGIGRVHGSSLGIVPFTLFYHDGGDEEEKLLDAFSENGDKSDQESNAEGSCCADTKKEMTWFKSMQQKFLKSVTARLTVAQVVEGIRSGAELTFDFVLYILSASMIAALGLMENSAVSLIASMLVSPLMGPILAATFGAMIQDKTLRNLGIKNGLFGLCLCITFGFLFGLITLDFAHIWNPSIVWPTQEMQGRGQSRSLWVGLLVAVPSGVGVGLAILAGNTASLVGVAISASLLPPAVNCGLLLAMALLKSFHAISEDPVQVSINGATVKIAPSFLPAKGYEVQYSNNMAVECAILGIVSLCLTLVNILCIVIVALIILKIKEVAPNTCIPQTTRFWKQDVRIARDYHKTLVQEEASSLGREFLEEWAHLTGLDPDKVMSERAEARLARMNTLQDMMEEIEADEVYQTVRRYMPGPHPDALRRLTLTWHPKNEEGRNSERHPSIFDIYSTSDRVKPISERRTSGGGRRILTRLFSVKQNHLQEAVHPTPDHREEEMKLTDSNHRRRESLLKQTLQRRPHSPYSLWPSNRTKPDSSRFIVTRVDEESEPESTAEVIVSKKAPNKHCLV